MTLEVTPKKPQPKEGCVHGSFGFKHKYVAKYIFIMYSKIYANKHMHRETHIHTYKMKTVKRDIEHVEEVQHLY